MIELKGTTKVFERLVAVNNINLTINSGEVLALLGPNGAGKTTTVRMLSAMYKPTSGTVHVAGYDAVKQPYEVRRSVGVLTEAPGLYTRMTGREYLNFFGEAQGIPPKIRRQKIEDLTTWFQISDALDRRLNEYSKGMGQKIALVRTLLHDPPVLLLDEPTSAMDPASARLVRNAIHKMRATDRTILICTHNLPEAEELADRIAIIRKGQIVETGTSLELKSRLLGPPLMEVQLQKPPHNGVLPLISRFVTIDHVQDQKVRYHTDSPEKTNPALLRALLEANIDVLTLNEIPRSLEAVYMRVVEEGIAQ